MKTTFHTTAEIETDEGDRKGLYVWRDDAGEKWFWSPRPTRHGLAPVDRLADADHVQFLCPRCFERNKGAEGTHMVMVTLAGRNVPDDAGSRGKDGPSRWKASGTGLDDLVLTPSILLNASQPVTVGCHWHGFVGSSGIPAGHAG